MLVIGSAPDALVQSVSTLYTKQIVMTGERYRHIVERHPELIGCEHLIIEAIRDPDAVHANDQDPNILLLYRTNKGRATVRIALWISDDQIRSNSVHSARLARAKEQERGVRRGKVLWKRG